VRLVFSYKFIINLVFSVDLRGFDSRAAPTCIPSRSMQHLSTNFEQKNLYFSTGYI